MSVIDDVLKPVTDDLPISACPAPWMSKLLEALNNAIVEHELVLECLTINSTGKELKEAIALLPAPHQITLINDNVISFGNRTRRNSDKVKLDEHCENMKDRQLKRTLIKVGVITFSFLAVLFIVAVVVISWKTNTTPDTEIASGLFNTLVQILKLIFSVT